MGVQIYKTENSIAIIWEKKRYENTVIYQVYLDGICRSSLKSNNYTFKNLKEDTEYKISVKAVALDGTEIEEIGEEVVRTQTIKEVRNIMEYGAVADGSTLNTQYIQKAIDECPKGGKVLVPQGVFLTGALFLKSDMTLVVEKDGVLLGSEDLKDYPIMQYRFEGLQTNCYASLLNAGIKEKEEIENLIIEGEGSIDANGSILRAKEREERAGQPGRAIVIAHAKNVYLKDITIKHSPAWCLHLIYGENICLNHVKIYTKCDENGVMYEGICNGDGVDLDSCKHVKVVHSLIASQDDCIAIKSGRNAEGRRMGIPSEDISISDCLFKCGFGVAIGSEMSGGIRNVKVSECVFQNTYSVLSIKAPRPRGGIVEDVLCEDCIHFNYDTLFEDCEWFRGAIYIDQFYSYKEFDSEQKKPIGEATPLIRNITFRNIEIDTVTGNAIYMVGLPEMPLKNITLDHIKAKGKNGMVMRNVEGLEEKNVSIILHKK